MLLKKTLIISSILLALGGSLACEREQVTGPVMCAMGDSRIRLVATDTRTAAEWIQSKIDWVADYGKRVKTKKFVPTHQDISEIEDLQDVLQRIKKCVKE